MTYCSVVAVLVLVGLTMKRFGHYAILKIENPSDHQEAILVPRNWQFHVFIVFKMRTSSNSTNLSVVPNFNIIIGISIMNYLHIPNFRYVLYSVAKVLAFSCFRYLQNDQILLILTMDLNFNTTIEISTRSCPFMQTFSLLLRFITKILAILCFPYLQNDGVIKFDQFCRLIQISVQ